MDGSARKNRPTQIFVAGCCFVLVMCAIQVWQAKNVSTLGCNESQSPLSQPVNLTPASEYYTSLESKRASAVAAVTVELPLQKSSAGLAQRPSESTEASIVDAFSSRLTHAQTHLASKDQAGPGDADLVDPAALNLATWDSLQSPISITGMSGNDFDFSQPIAGQELTPSPPIASQVRSSPEPNDLADSAKKSMPWHDSIVPKPESILDQQREQKLLDEMIEDFEKAIEPTNENRPRERPTYRPNFDSEVELPKIDQSKPVEDVEKPAPVRPVPSPLQPKGQPTPATVDQSIADLEWTWPKPTNLVQQLDGLPPVYGVQQWVAEVKAALTRFHTLPSIADLAVEQYLDVFRDLIQRAGPISKEMNSRADQVAIRQAAYALRRRVDVWSATHIAAQPSRIALPSDVYKTVKPSAMLTHVANMKAGLARAGLANTAQWEQYLLLDRLEQTARDQGPFRGAARVELATAALDRLVDPNLTPAQLKTLKTLGGEAMGQELRLWATHPVSPQVLLKALERFEQYPNPVTGQDLANHRKDLHWSAIPSQNHIANTLEQHYRNANVRVSVNEAMLNRMVPVIRDMRQPVRDQVLGAQIQGHSTTQTRLIVRMLPDRSRLRLMFEARGVMAARTAATKGPVTLLNRNNSHFHVRKVVMMDQNGTRYGRAQAVANGNSNLLGLRTNYDNVPLLGSMVRRIAQKQHNEQAGLAKNIFVNRVEQEARSQVDRTIESELAAARRQLEDKVVAPLRRLDLDPRALDMQTQNGRMVLRGRLSADYQLAAHTARPQAHLGSFLTMQVHESALNNFFQQLQLDGRKASLQELYDEISAKLKLEKSETPKDIPDDVTIEFAKKAAVRVIIDEGFVKLELRIRQLKQEGMPSWKNFVVSANYQPFCAQAGGVEFYFSREKGIHLSKTKRNLALRAIFTKVLSQNRKIYLVNPELASDRRFKNLNVTQMELNDGWIGLSVGSGRATPSIAVRPTQAQR